MALRKKSRLFLDRPTWLVVLATCAMLLMAAPLLAGRYAPGTVVKGQGRDAMFVVLASGHLAHIPSIQALQCLELHRHPPLMVPPLVVDNFPKMPLLVSAPDGRVFRVEGMVKRHIQSPSVLRRLGYPTASILSATEPQLRCLADGPMVE